MKKLLFFTMFLLIESSFVSTNTSNNSEIEQLINDYISHRKTINEEQINSIQIEILNNYAMQLIPEKFKKEVLELCDYYEVPIYVFVGIIYQESKFKTNVINKNDNNTYDIGICQFNSKYISYYTDKYWDLKVDFNIKNYRHSMYLCIKHLRYLLNKYNDNDKAIIAYHIGENRVTINKIPKHGFEYLNKVKNFM